MTQFKAEVFQNAYIPQGAAEVNAIMTVTVEGGLGLGASGDRTFIEAMQNINKKIENPVFFLTFFGALVLWEAVRTQLVAPASTPGAEKGAQLAQLHAANLRT